MTDEETNTARRLDACKHFRWMSGMADDDDRVICVDGDTLHSGSRTDGGSDWHSAGAMGLPDLADPATLGCIEHGLLAEAWGTKRVEICLLASGGWRPVVYHLVGDSWTRTDVEVFFLASYPTKRDALVAALEAAP